MIRLSDLCPGECREVPAEAHCEADLLTPLELRCSCGLPWDPARGRHTRSGIRIPDDVYARILAREGRAIEVSEAREAFEEADAKKREGSPMAIALRTLAGLRLARRRR